MLIYLLYLIACQWWVVCPPIVPSVHCTSIQEGLARDSTENEEEHATARNSRNQPHVKAQKATLNETSSLRHTGTDISKYNIGSKLHGTGNVNCAKCPLNGKPKVEGCGGGDTMLIGEAPGATEAKVGKPIEGFTPEEVARDSTENREGRAKTCNSCKTSHVEAHKTTPKKTSSRTSTGTDIDKYNIGSKLHGTTNCDKCPLNKQSRVEGCGGG
jgi:hypothetical protein